MNCSRGFYVFPFTWLLTIYKWHIHEYDMWIRRYIHTSISSQPATRYSQSDAFIFIFHTCFFSYQCTELFMFRYFFPFSLLLEMTAWAIYPKCIYVHRVHAFGLTSKPLGIALPVVKVTRHTLKHFALRYLCWWNILLLCVRVCVPIQVC